MSFSQIKSNLFSISILLNEPVYLFQLLYSSLELSLANYSKIITACFPNYSIDHSLAVVLLLLSHLLIYCFLVSADLCSLEATSIDLKAKELGFHLFSTPNQSYSSKETTSSPSLQFSLLLGSFGFKYCVDDLKKY